MATLRILKTITFAYDPHEDRILAAINAGRDEAWSCWITRRQVLALLDGSVEFVASTSPVMPRVSAPLRPQIAAFEREAAVATTAKAMSRTPPEVMKAAVPAAELVQRLSFTHKGDSIRMEVRDGAGGADGVLTRAEFQRILQMLQLEAAKANWLAAPISAPAAAADDRARTPKPH